MAKEGRIEGKGGRTIRCLSLASVGRRKRVLGEQRLGAREIEVIKGLCSVRCRALSWPSRATRTLTTHPDDAVRSAEALEYPFNVTGLSLER